MRRRILKKHPELSSANFYLVLDGCEAGQSTGKMVAALRERALSQTVDKITTRNEIDQLNIFRARWHQTRVYKKPVNHLAEDHNTEKIL